MRVGIGLPSIIPKIPGDLLVEWARTAEAGPFTSLGVLDRLNYDSYDPFVALAAAAAATHSVGLVTMVVIGPLRPAGTLAKQAASVDALSGGRLTLGVALGARADDYEAAGVPALWGQAYFSLGDEERGADYLRDYYAFTGPFAEKIAAGNLTSPQAVLDLVRGYEEAGCDELVLLPTVPDLLQLDRMADVLASRA